MQITLNAGSGPMTQKGWNVSVERPERDAEDNSKKKISNKRCYEFY